MGINVGILGYLLGMGVYIFLTWRARLWQSLKYWGDVQNLLGYSLVRSLQD